MSSQPPRPPNSFMCFRSDRFRHYQRSAKDAAPLLQTELSKRVAKEWNDLDSERRAHYEGVAAEKKAEHMRMYPGYKYQPRRKGEETQAQSVAQARVGTRTRTKSTPASTARPSAASSGALDHANSRLPQPPPLEPNFATLPSTAYPPPYSPFSRSSSSSFSPSPAPLWQAIPEASSESTRYVPVPAATYRRLVNTQQPPSRTVNPPFLYAPHLLMFSSMGELEEAVALAEGRRPSPSAFRGQPAGKNPLCYVPVAVQSLYKPGALGGATPTRLVEYSSMDALRAEAVLADDPPAAFLDPVTSFGGANARMDLLPAEYHLHGRAGAHRDVGLRRRDAGSPAPLLGEGTRWRVVYPGMATSDVDAPESAGRAARSESPMLWEYRR